MEKEPRGEEFSPVSLAARFFPAISHLEEKEQYLRGRRMRSTYTRAHAYGISRIGIRDLLYDHRFPESVGKIRKQRA